MLDSSIEFKQLIRNNTKCSIVATMTLADSTVLNLTGDDFMGNMANFDDSTSASGNFQIGACVVNTISFVLNNYDGKFDSYDFTNAIIKPTITKELSASTELIPKTFYVIDQPKSISSTISLTGNDYMNKFSKDYFDVTTSYPATWLDIVNDICNYCGVILDTQTFTGYSNTINERPDDNSVTCLDVLSYIAQISGNYGRINTSGHLEFKWYDLSMFSVNQIDGGGFEPYTQPNIIDGGDFTTYQTTNIIDGGNFTDKQAYNCYAVKDFSVSTDNVVITGINVKTFDNKLEHLQGLEGYTLEVSSNPFVTSDNYLAVATLLGDKIIGMLFRPFSISALSDPTIEAGDSIKITKNGNVYNSVITRCNYKFGDYETFENTAESPASNNSTSYSASTKTYNKSREATDKQFTSYDLQLQNLTQLQANAFGTFTSQETLLDGSVIYYYHNKPERSQSSIIWKFSAGAFTVSTDGGSTWNAGIDAQGNAVVNVLSAIGINAFWINVGDLVVGGTSNNTDGSIVVKDTSNNEIGRWNKNGISITKGSFNINNKFVVDSSGNMTATNGTFSGNISGSSITGGTISGTNITGNTITGGTLNVNNRCVIDSSGNLTASNVNLSGVINASSGSFTGTITSSSGTIGGWSIGSGHLIFDYGSVGAGMLGNVSNASIAFYAGANSSNIGSAPFRVTHNGELYASNATITGTITGSTINGTTINGGNIHITDISSPSDETRMYITTTGYGTYFSPGGVRAEGSGWYSAMGYTAVGIHNSSDTYKTEINTQGLITSGAILANGDIVSYGNLSVSGTKNRIINTENYGDVLHYAYETASPYFGDIGEGITDDEGVCAVTLEDIFSETIDTNVKYQVFLQKYGEGELYVCERNKNYFVVKGSQNLSFGWELKAVQLDYDSIRLEKHKINEEMHKYDDISDNLLEYTSQILDIKEESQENDVFSYMEELSNMEE